MAMRLGRRIYGYVHTNSVSAVSTSGRSRSYSSGLVSRLPEGLSTVIAVEGFGFALCAGWCYRYDVFNCRTKVEVRKAEKKAMEMLERLNRESDKHTDAFLETLEREVHAMREKLSDRKIDSLDAETYLREIAVLKAHVVICEKGMRMTDIGATVSRAPSDAFRSISSKSSVSMEEHQRVVQELNDVKALHAQIIEQLMQRQARFATISRDMTFAPIQVPSPAPTTSDPHSSGMSPPCDDVCDLEETK